MKKISLIILGAAGRMGSILTRLASEEKEYELVGVLDLPENLDKLENPRWLVSASLENLLDKAPNSVLMDFTSAKAALEHAKTAAGRCAGMVIGATGLSGKQKDELAVLAKRTPILWSANMSIGINVILRLLPKLTRELGGNYDVEMMEIHHRRKKDAPSGTALMLGEVVAKARDWEIENCRKSSRDGLTGERRDQEIGVMALRGGDVVGIHSVYFFGPGEFIEIKHQAESRETFAQGALRAAAWIADKPAGPLYSMQDVISSLE